MTRPYIYKNDYNKDLTRICIFCTYLHTEVCPDYILHYIKTLHQIGYAVIVVSHSDITEKDLSRLSEYCCTIVVKENEGYDFFAWKYGMSLITDFDTVEHLLLANDSIIGPFNDVNGLFSKMNSEYDFWGLTENYEYKYHIQSYFLHANKKVLNSKTWKEFWDELVIYENKLDIVTNYEIKLSQTLVKSGDFKVGAWVSQKDLTTKYPAGEYVNYPATFFWHDIANPTVKYWKELLTEFEFPFIKKNLLLGKEHYHYSFEGQVYEYNVFPVNWKNIIEKKYGSQAVSLITDYADGIFNKGIEEKKNYSVARYKVLFIYDSINSSAEIDYLVRILQFYNRRSIETELIVNSAPSLRIVFEAKLQDITKVNILAEMSVKSQAVLKHRLSQEYVGTIIIGNAASAKLAQYFSYTNAPHILITADQEPHQSIEEGEYNFNFHAPFIVSPFAINNNAETAAGFDPIELPLTAAPINKKEYGKVAAISFVGLNDFKTQKSQITALIQTLKGSGYIGNFRLYFNSDEYNELKNLIKAEPKLLSTFEDSLNCTFIQYDNIASRFTPDEEEIIISYFNDTYLPDEYLQCYLYGRLVFTQKNNDLHKSLFGNPDKYSFDYFKVDTFAQNLQVLLQDQQQYQAVLKEQNGCIIKYLHQLPSDKYEELLFHKVVDFTELLKKEPIITVIFHFHFYSFDEVSFINYKRRLRAFYKSNINFLFSITEDSYEIQKHVDSLKNAFPYCVIKIVPNKGRDIGAKFLLFDYFVKSGQPSEYIVVLHDKKSLHLPFWEAKIWIDSLLKIIDPLYYNKVLKSFNDDKTVGIIGSEERVVDCIIKWDNKTGMNTPIFEWNNDLLHQMIKKYSINITDYNFVGGTMFWIKSDLLKKLNDKYKFISQYMLLEEGNVMDNSGSTITHSWERLICWLSTNNGYKVGKI